MQNKGANIDHVWLDLFKCSMPLSILQDSCHWAYKKGSEWDMWKENLFKAGQNESGFLH